MGEPLIGSVICGAVALGMMWWNWQMMEAQKRRGRRVAIEAAKAGRVRAQTKADAVAAKVATSARATKVAATAPAKQPQVVPSSSCLAKLEPLLDCPASTSGGGPSPRFIKSVRDRTETAPMSPPASSQSAAETGFFADGCEAAERQEQQQRVGREWPKGMVGQCVPLMVPDLDVAVF